MIRLTNGSVPAAARSAGRPVATFPGAVAGDAQLAIAVDREQTKLALPLSESATSMTVQNAAGIAIWSLLSIEDEIVQVNNPPAGNVIPIKRGFDGTTPALHLTGATVAGLIVAYHHNTLVSEVEAIQTALGPHLSNIPASLFVSSGAYNFPPQTPGGTLIVGANSITVAPVPPGVNATDVDHYLFVSGTGTPEAAKIIGGNAVAGNPSGQLIIQCANAHPAGWQISSAMGGVSEAYSAIAATGGTILVPLGVTTAWANLRLNAPNITIAGLGWGSVIKAGNNAAILGGIIVTNNAATGFVLRDICIDGNRANNGMNAVTGTSGQWALGISASENTIDRVEIRFSSAIGIFVGDSTIVPAHVVIQNCYIHNNGGVTVDGSHHPAPGGFGIGIMSGGNAQPSGMAILNNRIEENYNTVTSPGDSCALNLISTENLIEGNYIKNNYNLSGGQIAVGTASGSAGASFTTIRGNVLLKPGSFGGDHTTGIEVNSSYINVIGNTVQGCESGVYIEDFASHVTVTGNTVSGTTSAGAGVRVAGATPGPSTNHIQIIGNMLSGLPIGVLVVKEAQYVSVIGNDVTLCGQAVVTDVPFPAASNLEIIDNLGYNGNFASSAVAAITVGASPFTYTAGMRPEMIYVTGGTVSSIEKLAGGGATGVYLTQGQPTSMRLAPNSQIRITYSAAPTMVKDVQ